MNKEKIHQLTARIVNQRRVAEGYYTMRIECPQIARSARPGQFVTLRVGAGYEPLLRRPLGVHRIMGTKVELLYEVVGKGTRLLSDKAAGQTVDIMGPLGNGFDLSRAQGAEHIILVAGGMGVAPLMFLAEKVMGYARGKTIMLLGAKTRKRIVCAAGLRTAGCTVKIATDDGSRGHKGYVSELLKQTVTQDVCRPQTAIYACGPRPMLAAVAEVCAQCGLSAQVSLEEHMACGMGACLGCVVRTHNNGYQRVCKEGPVFDVHEVIW
ncbi:MAG: dihydroorotate dehydrogenase electron transfer subunit [Candidatus Omnitrophica bacterium]|nr:dihydroorotate dehydrogenase electron transfer subunit [Candidatus Omnitrophota bacterium]